MAQFSQAAGSSATYFTKTLVLDKLANKLGYKLIPSVKALGLSLGLVIVTKDKVVNSQ
jgi:hypothetical protein